MNDAKPSSPPVTGIPSDEALALAEILVNHQWGVSVYRLALAFDHFRNNGISSSALAEAEQIVLLVQTGTDEGWYNEDIAHEIATTLDRFRTTGIKQRIEEMTEHARLDSTGDETKAAFHIAVNWLSRRWGAP